MPDPEEPAQSQPPFPHVPGDLYVFYQPQAPNIAPELQRHCPQCKSIAGQESRWCWACGYDFDRADLQRLHPMKVLGVALLLSLCVNITLALIVAFRP